MARTKRKFGKMVVGFSGYYHYQVVREEFKSKKERALNKYGPGSWSAESSPNRRELAHFHIFTTCPSCTQINKFDSFDVHDDGRVFETCLICPGCRTHFFPKLMGWKKFLKEQEALKPTPQSG